VGALLDPGGGVRARAAGAVDVGPLDGYVFDLIRSGDPKVAWQVRVIAGTDPTPMPPVVATAALGKEQVDELRGAFLRVHEERSLDEARKTLLIDRFVVPELKTYDETKRRAERVEESPPGP